MIDLRLKKNRCKKCGHLIIHHINADEGYRCHGLVYNDKINDSEQCECRLKDVEND